MAVSFASRRNVYQLSSLTSIRKTNTFTLTRNLPELSDADFIHTLFVSRGPRKTPIACIKTCHGRVFGIFSKSMKIWDNFCPNVKVAALCWHKMSWTHVPRFETSRTSSWCHSIDRIDNKVCNHISVIQKRYVSHRKAGFSRHSHSPTKRAHRPCVLQRL